MARMPAPLLLLDGASMWFRSYFGVPSSITAPDGRPVNAVRGFIDSMAVVITQQRPSRLAVCLDLDWRPQFRVDLIPSYKAHRVAEPEPDGEPDIEEVPDELTPQVDMIMELLDAFGIPTAGAAGFEADDVLGTLAARERSDPVVVVSGDRDLLQVVADDPVPVRVLYLGRGLAKATLFGPERPTPNSRCCVAIRPTACQVCRASVRRPQLPCWLSTVRWITYWSPPTTRGPRWPRGRGRNSWPPLITSRPQVQ
jgi:5'-3' exonuclease